MGRKRKESTDDKAVQVSADAKEDIKKAETDETYEPTTQEGREARARQMQGSTSEEDAKVVEDQINRHLEPIKAGLRDRYRDFRASSGHPLKNNPAPGGGSMGYCVHCDNPVAMGQNYLCLDHVRVG